MQGHIRAYFFSTFLSNTIIYLSLTSENRWKKRGEKKRGGGWPEQFPIVKCSASWSSQVLDKTWRPPRPSLQPYGPEHSDKCGSSSWLDSRPGTHKASPSDGAVHGCWRTDPSQDEQRSWHSLWWRPWSDRPRTWDCRTSSPSPCLTSPSSSPGTG